MQPPSGLRKETPHKHKWGNQQLSQQQSELLGRTLCNLMKKYEKVGVHLLFNLLSPDTSRQWLDRRVESWGGMYSMYHFVASRPSYLQARLESGFMQSSLMDEGTERAAAQQQLRTLFFYSNTGSVVNGFASKWYQPCIQPVTDVFVSVGISKDQPKRQTETLMTWGPHPLNRLYSERDVLLQARISAGSMQIDEPDRRAAQQQLRLFLPFYLRGSFNLIHGFASKWNQPRIQPVSTDVFVSVGISKDQPQKDRLRLSWHEVPIHLITFSRTRCAASG